MVKLYDVNRSTAHLTPFTLCPGTMAYYMSPEALGEPPMYTDKLDSFSFGVLSVQIMTCQFPDPGDNFQIMTIYVIPQAQYHWVSSVVVSCWSYTFSQFCFLVV